MSAAGPRCHGASLRRAAIARTPVTLTQTHGPRPFWCCEAVNFLQTHHGCHLICRRLTSSCAKRSPNLLRVRKTNHGLMRVVPLQGRGASVQRAETPGKLAIHFKDRGGASARPQVRRRDQGDDLAHMLHASRRRAAGGDVHRIAGCAATMRPSRHPNVEPGATPQHAF